MLLKNSWKLKRVIMAVMVFLIIFTGTYSDSFAAERNSAAEKEKGIIREGKRYYNRRWTEKAGNADIISYIELEHFPYRINVGTTRNNKNNMYAILPNYKMEYRLYKNKRMYKKVKSYGSYEKIEIKKPGTIIIKVTKPEDRNHRSVTNKIKIHIVDKRSKSKITGVKTKYKKRKGSKPFKLKPHCWVYFGKESGWRDYDYFQDNFGLKRKDFTLYRYPSFKSSNKKVARVTSKGKVYIGTPGKAVITIKTKPRKKSVEGDVPATYVKPYVRKVTIIVKP